MNAVVLKIENNKAAVLDGNGSFRIIDDKAYSRGQIIDLAVLEYPMEEPETGSERKLKPVPLARKRLPFGTFVSRHISQAAAIVICIVLAGGMSVYAAPVKTVTSDMTPSLSYRLNVFNRVVRVEPKDEACTDAVKELAPDLAGKRLERAVDITRTTLEKTEEDVSSEETSDESSRGSDTDEQITDIDTDTDTDTVIQLPAEAAPEIKQGKPEPEKEYEDDMPEEPAKTEPAAPPEEEMQRPEKEKHVTEEKATQNNALNAAPSTESQPPVPQGFGTETGIGQENLREGSPGEMAAQPQENPPVREGMDEGETDPGMGSGPEIAKDRDQGDGGSGMAEEHDQRSGGPETAGDRGPGGGGF